MLWVPKMKFHSSPLYWSEGRNLRDWNYQMFLVVWMKWPCSHTSGNISVNLQGHRHTISSSPGWAPVRHYYDILMLSIHTLSHDAESYLMSRATFAWSGALGAQLRDEGTEVIFLFPTVSHCFGSLSPSVPLYLLLCCDRTHPPPPLSLSSSLSLLPSAVSEFPRVRQRETITLTDGFALFQFLSVRFLPALPLFHHHPLPFLLFLLCSPSTFILSLHQHECGYLCAFVYTCTGLPALSPSPPPPISLLPFLFLLLLFFNQYNWHRRSAPCRVC